MGRLNLFRQLCKVWIAELLVALFRIIPPPHFLLLEEPYHADNPKMLAKDGQTLLANLFQRHCLRIHGDITSKSHSNGLATRTFNCAVWRVAMRRTRSSVVRKTSTVACSAHAR